MAMYIGYLKYKNGRDEVIFEKDRIRDFSLETALEAFKRMYETGDSSRWTVLLVELEVEGKKYPYKSEDIELYVKDALKAAEKASKQLLPECRQTEPIDPDRAMEEVRAACKGIR
jgi:hypothetical protein